MANSPTIVSASLDDKEMRQSIANLVAYVKRATQTMSGDLDAAVEKMNASLKKLGTPATGGSANTSATKQDTQATEENTAAKKKNVQATKEQAQANKETKTTFDQIAQAQQHAVAPKSARESFYAFVQGYKQQAQELSQYIKSFETGLNQAISSRLNELNSQLSTSKLKAKELNEEINRRYASGNKQGVAQIQEQLDRELRTHNQIENAIKNVNKEFAFEISYLASLYGELNNIHNKWHDVNTTNKSLTESQKQQTEELRKQSAIVGEIKSKQDANKAFERISLMPTDNMEQAKEKLTALEELKKRVANTPLFSSAKNNLLNQAIETTEYKITSLERKTKDGAHIVSDSVKSMNAAIETNRKASVKAEEEKRQQIVQTGLAAQQTAKTIGESMSRQLSNGEQITQVKELENAWRQMQQALNNMTQEQLKSPVGQMLAETIAKTELAISAAKKYNEELSKTNAQQATRTPSSYNELNEILKQLANTYKNLSKEERSAAGGTKLADKIQQIGREAQKAQQQMSRPINLDAALRGSERTLDDIAYKMQRLRAYRQGIDLTKPTAANEIKQVDDALARLQKDADKWMSKQKSMIEQNNALGRSWNYMKNRLAFYFTVGATTSFVKQLIEVRSQYELLDRSIGILIDDARKGTAMFRELSEMALKSPFTLIELGSAAKQLVAYNIAQEDVVDTTRRLADMAAAVGLPIERLTYALGQVKAYGYLNSRDARIFLNAGIPIVQMLADMYNKQRDLDEEMVTAGQVREMMQKRLVSYADVMKVVNEATNEGGRFFNFQEKAADTLKVRLANLTLAWNNLLNDIGKSEQGIIQTGIKGLTTLFKHWRELHRIISTIAVAFGAYKTGALLASAATSQLTKNVLTAGTATKGLSVAIKSIPFAGWVSIIASIISYLFIFNDSLGEVGRKIQEISEDLEGFSKKTTDMYVKAMSSDKLSDQLEELKNMIRSFENEFGVTIPVNLEDVNEGNIKAKIKEVKDRIDNYLAFTSVFTTAGAENERLKNSFDEFGASANNVLNLITTNLSLVKQGMLDTGKTAKDVKIFDKKDGESTIEYLQRIVKLYEQLGLLGQKEVRPYIGFNPFKTSEDNTEELAEKQEKALTSLGIKNKEVFRNMMENAWNYYESLGKAQYQFERFAKELGSKIDINSIVDKKERTLKVEAAIDKYAAQNGLNQTAIELMKHLANQKFGVDIKVGIDPNAKKNIEDELQDWQKKLQQEADRNKIKLTIAFTSEQTPVSYAQEALTKVKDAMENLATQKRKKSAGTATQEDVENATNSLKKLREQARLAGADLASLDNKGRGAGGSRKDILGEALSKEVQLITDIRKRYEEYKKMGVDAQTSLTKATDEYGVSLKNVKKTLSAFGITGLEGVDVAGMEMRDIVKEFEKMRQTASLQGNVKGVEALEKAIASLNVEITKLDYKKITDGLNNELGKLKDEYELAVELDANPELGDMFLDMFGIDKSALSSSIDDYMFAVQNEFRKKSQELGYSGWGIDVFKANEETWKEWGKNAGLSDEALDNFKAKFVDAQNTVKKVVKDTITKTKELEYNLADTQGKIAIETTKLKKLQNDREITDVKSKDMSLTAEQRAFFANQKSLLDLQIKDQEQTIARLGDEVLQMLPTYKNLFNSIVEHSDVATRKIAKQWKEALSKAVKNANGTYTITDPNDPTKTTTITAKQYGTEVGKVDNELQKTTPALKKIQEAFKKGADGSVDWAKGIDLLGGELSKLAGIVSSIGDFAEQLGFSRETVEIINDVAASMNGVATMAQGVGQIASGDYIGGAASVLGGVMSAVGTWFDNSNNRITEEIEKSERTVKRLENSMKDLEDAANRAYGAVTSGAQRAVIANKELQLQEIKRQLQLEKSRASKDRDEDRIVELEGQYKEMLLEIKNGIDDVINEMLGISSAADAATQLVESMISAFKNGEDAMQAFSDKWDEMIDNMILKLIVSQYMQQAWENVLQTLKDKEEEMLASSSAYKSSTQAEIDRFKNMSDREKAEFFGIADHDILGRASWDENQLRQLSSKYLEGLINLLNTANESGEKASEDYLKWSLDYMMGEGRSLMEGAAQNLLEGLGEWYTYGQDKDKSLSGLRAGIQGITEDTAGALEAYMNIVSQRMFIHTDLLTEIRDAVVSFSGDEQMGIQSQILLQLQDSYTVQRSIESILEGVLNPSGRAFAVELIS